MKTNGFRITSAVFVFFIGYTAIATSNNLEDAGFDERFIAFSSAVTPWVIAATVVLVAGEIIKEMRDGKDRSS